MKKSLGFATATILIVATLALLAGGYLYWQRGATTVIPTPTTAPSPTPELTPLPTPENIGEWKESRLCDVTAFCFKYPPDWQEVTLGAPGEVQDYIYQPVQSALMGRGDYELKIGYGSVNTPPVFLSTEDQIQRFKASGEQLLREYSLPLNNYPSTLVTLTKSELGKKRIVTIVFAEVMPDEVFEVQGVYRGSDVEGLQADPYENTLLQIASTFEFKR